MTLFSQNSWPVIEHSTDPALRHFIIPGVSGNERLILRDGSAGFLLVHFACWYNEKVTPIGGTPLDDWGWNFRVIAGSKIYSNHASATAEDLNALKYPQGTEHMTSDDVNLIHERLKLYEGAIRWGGDYEHAAKDQMHFEINHSRVGTHLIARKLRDTRRGKAVVSANPGLTKAF
jgi:hypothetical protein